MTIKFSALGSGSGGNAYWVSGGGMEILIDFGLTRPQIIARLQHIGRDIGGIEAIVCTHAHRDHFVSLRPIGATASEVNRQAYLKTCTIPFYMTQRSMDFALSMNRPTGRCLEKDRWHELPERTPLALQPRCGSGGGIRIEATPVMHDCPGTVALRLTSEGQALGIVTDVGLATDELAESMAGLDALFIEFNHDPEMLLRGPYPKKVKRRIRSNYGHMSNAQAAELLERLVHPGLKYVGLSHISRTNNTPEIAQASAQAVLDRLGSGAEVFVCDQNLTSGVREITPSGNTRPANPTSC